MSTGSWVSVLAFGAAALSTSPGAQAQTSELWGVDGELWTADGRLPDFSFAGYHSGNDPIPTVPVVTNVRDFGAVGDGVTDDSDAFLSAIAATTNGAILIPAGRYRITKVLRITKSNVVLRGAGRSATTLYFPSSLRQTQGAAPDWAGDAGAWSWAGGYIWLQGQEQGTKLSNVSAAAVRGARTLTLANASGITPGMMIRLSQTESDGSLGRHLHADFMSAGAGVTGELVSWVTKVTAVNGNEITIERPLRVDVRLGWSPAVYRYASTVQEVGIEDLTIEFPSSTYPGHLAENGYNAFYLATVSQCWIRNVTILDADSGILTDGGISRFCTFQGIRLANQHRPTNVVSGHHGIALEAPQDMLITDFQIERLFEHDLTVDSTSTGNVFSNGRGNNINFDHHRSAPYENLFTNIDIGPGNQVWYGSRTSESGGTDGGPPSAARETFWNIRASNAMALPDWPQMTVVGMLKFATQKTSRLWVERIDPAVVTPQNLHEAQLARRLSGGGTKVPRPPTDLSVQ